MRLTWKKGDPNEPHIFWDSDFAKFTEGACFAWRGAKEDPEMGQKFRAWVNDAAVDMVQMLNSLMYINVHFTVVEPEMRWRDIANTHELYCAGHLLKAVIAHHQVTGSNEFLDTMCRYMDYISKVFVPGPGQLHGYPGHPDIELALVRLRSVRNEERYLDLLKYFVNERDKGGGEFYNQRVRDLEIDPMKLVPGWS